jgi:hypothetical protein
MGTTDHDRDFWVDPGYNIRDDTGIGSDTGDPDKINFRTAILQQPSLVIGFNGIVKDINFTAELFK